MNKSYRIRTEVGSNADKNIKLKLDQEYDKFEILSLQIDQSEDYLNFNSDFGVVVGRVTANNGVGVPNVRISIFIPLSEDDELRPEIKAIYPYKSPRQQNSDGKRYNLLPRVATEQPDGSFKPEQPFGSFPTKAEIVTNDAWLEVYEKYYKLNALTNQSGDYMIFGVPVGTQIVHMSADITDIGEFSMTPTTMINQLGFSENLFNEEGTRIKPQRDLDDLVNIDTQEKSVDVIPFFGDNDNFDIGITRQDFRIRAQVSPSFVIFGSTFTNNNGAFWGNDIPDNNGNSASSGPIWAAEYYFEGNNVPNPRLASEFRNSIPIIKVYSLSPTVSTEEMLDPNYTPNFDVDFVRLQDDQFSLFTRDGDFALAIPCNRDRVITNEVGENVLVGDDSDFGLATTFSGFITIEYDDQEIPIDQGPVRNINSESPNPGVNLIPVRARYKIPQGKNFNQNLGEWYYLYDFFQVSPRPQIIEDRYDEWRRDFETFEAGKFYSVSKFHSIVRNFQQAPPSPAGSLPHPIGGFLFPPTIDIFRDQTTGLAVNDELNFIVINGTAERRNVGLFATQGIFYPNYIENPSGAIPSGYFGANWLNFSIYFEQHARTTNSSVGQRFRINSQTLMLFENNNTVPFVGGDFGREFYSRADLNKTRFVEVPREDIVTIRNSGLKAFTDSDLSIIPTPYKKGTDPDTPFRGGRRNGDPNDNPDNKVYFFTGLPESQFATEANCIEYLFELGLIQ